MTRGIARVTKGAGTVPAIVSMVTDDAVKGNHLSRMRRNRLVSRGFIAALCAVTGCGGTGDPTAVHSITFDPAIGASLNGRRPFPADNPWNADITSSAVDPNSATLIASCGLRNLHADFGTVFNGAPNGIPYVVVFGGQPKVPVSFDTPDESDPGPYPIPPNAPVEGGATAGGDRHVIVIDATAWKLYELFDAHSSNGGASWHAGSGAVFDLNSNALRPADWTSADAAGLPIFPGLVRYDEAVDQHAINHALRFTCPRSRKAFVSPARHFASSDTSSALPPMGMRVRLEASFDTSSYSPTVRTILRAMMQHGMLMADNGTGWYVSGAPDPRWDDADLATLARVPSTAFEVVKP
jgi:hypothetical protein